MRDKIKRFVGLFLCIAVAFGSHANAFANSNVLKFTSIEITGKSETATIEAPSVSSDGQIQGGIVFGSQGDYVDYRLVIENSDNYSYRIDSVEDNNIIDNLSVTYIHDDTIEAGVSSDLLVHLEYIDKLINTEPVELDDLQITLRFTRINGSNEDRQEVSPNTSDGIMKYSFASGIVLLAAMVLVRRVASSRVRIMGIGTALILIGASSSLYIARAENFEELNLMFSSIHLDSEYEEYTITIDTGDGPVSRQVVYGTKLSDLLARPTKTGYHFDKWTDAYGNEIDEDGIVTGPISITANMVPNQYNVAFHISGAETTSQAMTYDTSANLDENSFDWPGYIFVGWANSDGGEVVYADGQNVKNLTDTTDDVNFYAVWTPRTDIDYTVRHKYENLMDDNFTNDDEVFHNGSVDTDITPSIKHVDGFIDPAQKTERIAADGSTIIEYEYLRNRVQLSLEDEEYITEGSSVEGEYKYGYPIALTAIERTGFDFTGWNNGSSVVSNNRVYEFNITSSVTLRPTYETQKFTITVDRSDGNAPVTHNNVEYGTLLSTLLGDEPSKTGYAFTGWTDGDEAVSGLTVITSAMNVVANFEANKYLVVFHANDGTEVINSQEMTYDESANLDENSFERPGYEFAGWATSTNGEAVYADKQSVSNLTTTTDNVDLYAVWTKLANIHYTVLHRYQKAVNPNEYDDVIEDLYGSVDTEYNTDSILREETGFNNPVSRTYTIEASGNTQVVLEYPRKTFQLTLGNTEYIDDSSAEAGEYRYEYPISVAAKARTGYDFAGWYSGETKKSSNTTYAFNITENTTLEPRYQIQSYIVTIDKADGSVSAEYSIEYGTALAEYLVEPQVTGYHFVEWRDGGDRAVTDETIVEGPMAITAIIAPNVYHIVFNTNGGTGTMPDLEMTYDEPENLTANVFTRAGYTFDGWATSADGEKLYEDGDEVNNLTTGTDDVTLYAKWKLRTDIPYTVYHRYERVGTGFDQEEASASGSVDTDITPETVPREGFQDPVADGSTPIPGQIDANGESYFIYNYYRVQKQLTLNSAEYIGTDTPTGSYKYGTTITVTAFDRLRYEFKGWSTDNGDTITDTNATYSFEITEDTTLTPVYEEIPFYYVFNHPGACEFSSTGTISGDDCEFAGSDYIDTGVKLYDEANYDIDYEIGFTIDEYGSEQVEQATLVNAKYENSSVSSPGLAVRKSGNTANIEITQTVNRSKNTRTVSSPTGKTVKIVRIDGIVYTSIDGGAYQRLQDNRGTSNYHDITTWFGASYNPNDADNPVWRKFSGKLSNMYIKMGTHDDSSIITVSFNADGGTVDPTSLRIPAGHTIKDLPIPVSSDGKHFMAWYTTNTWEQYVMDDVTVFNEDTTLYARWANSGDVCEVDGVPKTTIGECVTLARQTMTSETPAVIVLLNDINKVVLDFVASDNIVIDGRGLKLSSNENKYIIESYGKVRVENTKFSSLANQAAINVKGGTFDIYGGSIEVTSTSTSCRQAINTSVSDSVVVNIYDGTRITSACNQRAPIQVDKGTVNIVDAMIISETFSAIDIARSTTAGTITLGSEDNSIDNSTPSIRSDGSNSNAIKLGNEDTLRFYDGRAYSKGAAIGGSVGATEQNAVQQTAPLNSDFSTYNWLYYVLP